MNKVEGYVEVKKHLESCRSLPMTRLWKKKFLLHLKVQRKSKSMRIAIEIREINVICREVVYRIYDQLYLVLLDCCNDASSHQQHLVWNSSPRLVLRLYIGVYCVVCRFKLCNAFAYFNVLITLCNAFACFSVLITFL